MDFVAHGWWDSNPFLSSPLLISLTSELAFGGIDNIVIAELQKPARGTFLPSALGLLVLCGTLSWTTLPLQTLQWIAVGLAALSTLNAAFGFFSNRALLMQKGSKA